MGSLMPSSKWGTLLPSFAYHFETQLLWMNPSLSTIMCSFFHPLLFFFLLAQGPSPWIDKPVLSTMRWSGLLGDWWRPKKSFGFLLLRDSVVWSGTGRRASIRWNKDFMNPSVCRKGRWKRSLRGRTVSIARSEYFCCLPGFPDFGDFHDFSADNDIHRVSEPLLQREDSYSLQFVTLDFGLYLGLRLFLCNSCIFDPIIG